MNKTIGIGKKCLPLLVLGLAVGFLLSLGCGDDDDDNTDSWQVILVFAFFPYSGTTAGGVGIGSTYDDMVAEFTDPEYIDGDEYWYDTIGIMFLIDIGEVLMIGVFEPNGGLPSPDDADIVPGLKIDPIYLGDTYADVRSELGTPDDEDCESIAYTCIFTYEEGIGVAVSNPASIATKASITDRKAELKEKVGELLGGLDNL